MAAMGRPVFPEDAALRPLVSCRTRLAQKSPQFRTALRREPVVLTPIHSVLRLIACAFVPAAISSRDRYWMSAPRLQLLVSSEVRFQLQEGLGPQELGGFGTLGTPTAGTEGTGGTVPGDTASVLSRTPTPLVSGGWVPVPLRTNCRVSGLSNIGSGLTKTDTVFKVSFGLKVKVPLTDV